MVSHVTSKDGTRIGCFTTGSGPPVLLVHGLLGDHSRWDALLPHLEPHLTVHAMDRRGRGASGDQPDYDKSREVEDVTAVVDAVARAAGSTVDVLGSSGGASFVLGAAASTGSIGRLVLFEPPTGAVAELVPPSFHQRLAELLAAGDREAVLEAAYRTVVGLSDAEIEHLRAQPAWPNRIAAAHTVPRELAIPPDRFFDPAQAAEVTAPALLLVGGETADAYRRGVEAVAAALPNASLSVIEGHGHGAELFAAETVASRVIDFLQATS